MDLSKSKTRSINELRVEIFNSYYISTIIFLCAMEIDDGLSIFKSN